MPDCIGGSFVVHATAWTKDNVHVIWSVSHNIWRDKAVRIFCKGFISACVQFDLALGIVSIVLGIIIIKKTEYIIEILSTAIGIFMLVDGAFKIQTAVEAKRFGIENWWLILVMSFAVTFVGILLFATPFETASMIVRLIGLNLSLDGILNLFVVRNTVETIRRNTKWEI